jgi:hypothetical protein
LAVNFLLKLVYRSNWYEEPEPNSQKNECDHHHLQLLNNSTHVLFVDAVRNTEKSVVRTWNIYTETPSSQHYSDQKTEYTYNSIPFELLHFCTPFLIVYDDYLCVSFSTRSR